MSQRSNVASAQRKKNGFSAYMRQNAWLYIFLIPGMVFLFIMNYLPMFGIVIAFKDFRVVKGIMGSPGYAGGFGLEMLCVSQLHE